MARYSVWRCDNSACECGGTGRTKEVSVPDASKPPGWILIRDSATKKEESVCCISCALHVITARNVAKTLHTIDLA